VTEVLGQAARTLSARIGGMVSAGGLTVASPVLDTDFVAHHSCRRFGANAKR
jgi:hypothetical protein